MIAANLFDLTGMAAPLANHLWQSTAVAAAAALLAVALRKNDARTRSWLWMAASLKFLAPFSLLVAIGAQVQWQSAPIAIRAAAVSAVDDIGAPFARVPLPVETPAADTTSIALSAILLAVWVIGSALVAIRWWMRWHPLAAAVHAAHPLTSGRQIEAFRRVQQMVTVRQHVCIAISESLLEPGVFGISRPVLLLPAGIADRLSDAQLDAIVAHELCHVRRNDNLAAALHMAVEAIFWFHPVVWWIGRRLVEERERACDEDVLRLGNDSRVYAESILRACQFYLQSPVACVSGIAGGGLKQRIERIMRRQVGRNLGIGCRVLLGIAAAAAVGGPVLIGIAGTPLGRAQSRNSGETFDVVSVKPAAPGQRGRGFVTDPGRMRMMNVTLGDCILVAYGVQTFQISAKNLPSERWEIIGTARTHPSRILDARYETMMQALLADRFGLKLHRETRVMQVYAMEAAKSGLKLKESKEPGLSTRSTPGHVTATGATLADLAAYLSRHLDHPVVNVTGIQGLYDFKLDWTPSESEASLEPPDPDKAGHGDPFAGPSLYTALEEQLGIKITNKKLPVEVLVIDHWERPAEN
ncbi:MAG TPA: M56 family metallopeptidase [Bryobacteraceae bacterium]|jgi:uncharacterized protein (TIGR03435 family)